MILTLASVATALVEYECATTSLNISTFLLLDIADCDIPKLQPYNNTIYVQLLQSSNYQLKYYGVV